MSSSTLLAALWLGAAPTSLFAIQDLPQGPDPVPVVQEPSAGEARTQPRTEAQWQARERELLQRIQELQQELAQEQALRLQREQEWMQFTQLLQLVPEDRRPAVPEFLQGESVTESIAGTEDDTENSTETQETQRALELRQRRAQEIKRTLRAYLLAEGQQALDLMEVGSLHPDGIGPIVARQLDGQGRFLSTLVADRLRLEKSASGYTLTLVLERGYERRAGKTWPFPSTTRGSEDPVALPAEMTTQEAREGATDVLSGDDPFRKGSLRFHLTGVAPGPWLEAMPELFSQKDRDTVVDDGRTNLIRLRFALNGLLDQNTRGARWKLVHLGGVVGEQWRQLHFAELDRRGRVVRRLFADRANLRLEGRNAIFEMQAGAQERNGRRSAFLGGRYTLLIPGVNPELWRTAQLPGISKPGEASPTETGTNLPAQGPRPDPTPIAPRVDRADANGTKK